MPGAETIVVTRGDDRRKYRVLCQGYSPERAEAVAFFRGHAGCLFPAMKISDEVVRIPIGEANEYLRRHPNRVAGYGIPRTCPAGHSR